MREIDPLTGEVLAEVSKTVLYPASHFVSAQDNLKRAASDIRDELAVRLTYFKEHGQLVEASALSSAPSLTSK